MSQRRAPKCLLLDAHLIVSDLAKQRDENGRKRLANVMCGNHSFVRGYVHGNAKNYINVTIYNGRTIINCRHLIGNLFDNLLQANALNESRDV